MPSNTAKALVAGLAIVGAAAGVQANSNPTTNDIQALNYALGLEHLEAAFYRRGLAKYNAQNFTDAGYSRSVYDYVTLIGAHEAAHVTALTDTVRGSPYNGQAGVNCTSYRFSDNTVQEFLRTAIILEDVGVSAYVAALNHITNPTVQQAAATIATVEARHAAYLRAVAGGVSSPASTNPFPEGVNTARIPDQVVQADVAGQFFPTETDNCKNFLTALPAVRPAGVATNTTLAAARPSSVTPTNPAPTYTQAQFDADIGVLNYALTLEHLEADFYNTFASTFNAAAFNAVPGLSGQGDAIVTNIGLVRAHENAHVTALTSIITSRTNASVPVTAGCYDWSSVTTAAQFLATANVLENTGVSAYDGAANTITDTGLQQIAASVAVVEARHAQYLQLLNNQTTQSGGRNAAVDTATVPADIVSAVLATGFVRGNRLTGGCAGVPTGSNGNTGTTNNGGGSTASNNNNPGSGAFVAPIAIVSTLLAVASALLF